MCASSLLKNPHSGKFLSTYHLILLARDKLLIPVRNVFAKQRIGYAVHVTIHLVREAPINIDAAEVWRHIVPCWKIVLSTKKGA
jgi:hypothetical protein